MTSVFVPEASCDLALASTRAQLQQLCTELLQEANHTVQEWQPWLRREDFRASAHNLATYLALRRRNLTTLENELRSYGVGSLSGAEEQLLPSLHLSAQALDALAGQPPCPQPRLEWQAARGRLKQASRVLFGRDDSSAATLPEIMVTFPSEAASDPRLVRDLLDAGMTIARINAAHDDAAAWAQMIGHLRAAEQQLGRPPAQRCRIHIDLAGPKVRTQQVQFPVGARNRKKDPQRLYLGDSLFLLRQDSAEAALEHDHLPCLRCSLPAAVEQAQRGQQVWFDDGKIGSVVEQVTPQGLLLRVTHARRKGEKLKDEKGINFPDTALHLPALTDKDMQDLAFAVSHADTLGYSFVQTVEDVESLLAQMERLGARNDLGIILKIETRLAVENCAQLMARTAAARPCGVMIARGDLAVELGFGRLAEIQEDLLLLCAAAHVPVVWATQVLESLVKKGLPTRGEFTDAAAGIRAEAVMLNKGPYIVQGVKELRGVLTRMHQHQHKAHLQWQPLELHKNGVHS